MSPELEAKLYERYPKIFAERQLAPQETAMCWGIAAGDGWFGLIDALCECLQREADNGDGPQPVAMQVKEKFGTLRFRMRDRSERQAGMLELALEASARICEVCGAAAVSPPRNGASMARCEAHTSASQ